MKQELSLVEAMQLEIEYEEKKYEHALTTKQPIEDILIIQKRIEYLKVTLEAIEERYANEQTKSSTN